MKRLHPMPDPVEHPDFHEEGHWFTNLAAVDLFIAGALITAAILGFWAVLAWVVFRQ